MAEQDVKSHRYPFSSSYYCPILSNLLGILATVTAAKKIGGDVDIVVAGFSLESTVGKEAAAVAGN